ncbi:MAG: hypothetical protein U1E78_11495 [Gammaproteobacteria bacterium]
MWRKLLRWVNVWGQYSPVEPIFFLPNVYYPADLSEEAENSWCEQFLLDKAPGALIFRVRENGFLIVSVVFPQQEIKHFCSKEISVNNRCYYYRGSQITTLGELTQALYAEYPDFLLSVRYWLVPELDVRRIFIEQAQLFRSEESSSSGDSLKITQFYQRFGLINVFCLPDVFYPTSSNGEIPPTWIHAYLRDQEVGACILHPSSKNDLVIHFVDTKDHYSKEITLSSIQSSRLQIRERAVWNGGERIRTMQELLRLLQREFPDKDLSRSLHFVSEIDARRIRFTLGIKHLSSCPTFLSEDEIESFLDKIRVISAQLQHEGYCCLKGSQVEVPRLALDGFSYEKEIVEAWFQSSEFSPVTDLRLEHTGLRENWMLKDILRFFSKIKPVLDEALETSTIQFASFRSGFAGPGSFNEIMRSFMGFSISLRGCMSSALESSEERDLAADLENVCLELESLGQCAIRYVRIESPGTLETGHTFEKREIKAWLEKNMTCPQTATKLQDISIWDNHSLLGPLRILNELEQLLPNLCLLLKNLKPALSDDHEIPVRGVSIPIQSLRSFGSSFLPVYTRLRLGPYNLANFMPRPPLLLTYSCPPSLERVKETEADLDGAELSFSVESPSPNL